jgi:RNA polymerase sigma factor (sigma-70 family)
VNVKIAATVPSLTYDVESDLFNRVSRLARWTVIYHPSARRAARAIRVRRLGDWRDIMQEARVGALLAIRDHHRKPSASLTTFVVNRITWRLLQLAWGGRVSRQRDALRVANDLTADPVEPEQRSAERIRQEETDYSDLRAAVATALSHLTAREATILRLRFGLDGEDGLTLEATGKLLRITKERVRQLESRAIRRLQNPRVSVLFKPLLPVPS